ncbi:MAG: hypothetical protein LBS39_04785 [Campylobacteraceae bacterium]|nr:hypothetical protein [Campylobacteraceae bacterium]
MICKIQDDNFTILVLKIKYKDTPYRKPISHSIAKDILGYEKQIYQKSYDIDIDAVTGEVIERKNRNGQYSSALR